MNYQNSKIKEGLLIGGFFFLFFFLAYIGHPIPCLFYKITGLYCPGCGVSRMIFALIKLDFQKAFHFNPLCFTYLILYSIYLMYCLLMKIVKKESKKIPNQIISVALIITILFGILRNLPGFEFLTP